MSSASEVVWKVRPRRSVDELSVGCQEKDGLCDDTGLNECTMSKSVKDHRRASIWRVYHCKPILGSVLTVADKNLQ